MCKLMELHVLNSKLCPVILLYQAINSTVFCHHLQQYKVMEQSLFLEKIQQSDFGFSVQRCLFASAGDRVLDSKHRTPITKHNIKIGKGKPFVRITTIMLFALR